MNELPTDQDPPLCVVVGAAGPVGRATAIRLALDGWDLFVIDTDPAALELTRQSVIRAVPSAQVANLALDVTAPSAVDSAAQKLADSQRHVRGVALVAGDMQQAAAVTTLEPDEWDRVHASNLRGPYLCARALVPLMPEHSGAALVTISSWWGRGGHAYFSAYCSAKAGLISFTQCLADELAPRGIRANVICPGNINTGTHRQALASEAAERNVTVEEVTADEWSKIPLGYAGSPSTVADGVAFLLSDRASYITGASLDINGGARYN